MMVRCKKAVVFLIILSFIFFLAPSRVFGSIMSESEFENYLDAQGRLYNSARLKANYSIYKDPYYNQVIVYGTPWGDERYSKDTKRIERRYLGYTFENQPFTNTFFPADPGGGGDPTTWQYVKQNDAAKSWNNLNSDQEQYMLTKSLKYSGVQYPVSVNSIGGKDYAKLLTPAAWSQSFSVYTKHKAINGDGIRYATLYGDPMGSCTLNCSVTTPSNTYTIISIANSVTVPVTVTTTATLSGAYVKDSQINTIQAIFEDCKTDEKSKTTTSVTANKVLQRANFTPGTHTITLKGQGYLQSIFGDQYTAAGTKTITLIVEEPPYPYVKVTSTAEPAKKKFDDNDINVTVNVSATLHNFTDVSKIDYWVLYARKAEILTASPLNRPAGLSATGSFTFTIPKENLDGIDEYTQEFITRAKVVFKDGTFKDAPSSCSTLVYKDIPPVEDPPPPPVPEAFIKAYGAFKENRRITLDFTGSKNHNASMNQVSIVPVSGGSLSDIKYTGNLNGITSKDVLFKKPGTYRVTLTVSDGQNTDTDTRDLVIAPDTPPFMDLRVPSPVYRDYSDYNQADIKVCNFSYSADQDNLTELNAVYYYDSDNDGSFDDEQPKEIYNGVNKDELELKAPEVGKYMFRFTLKEDFGQPTMPEFITQTDYRQSVGELVVEVANYAPMVDFSMVKKKKVDVYINVGETAHKDLALLNSKINSDVKPILEANGIEANIMVRNGEGEAIGIYPQEQTVTPYQYESSVYLAVTNQGLTMKDGVTYTQATNTAGVFGDYGYYVALKKDGTVWGWGQNNYFGQIPVQNLGDRSLAEPTLYHDITDVIDVVPAYYFTAFLKKDGTLWTSGNFITNTYLYWMSAPVYCPYTGVTRRFTNINDIKQIEGDNGCLLLLRADGTVWGWGDNTHWQLGPISCTSSTDSYGVYRRYTGTLQQIPGLTNIKKIVMTSESSFAIQEDGTVWAWGNNYSGQLGVPGECNMYGSTTCASSDKDYNRTPVIVPNLNGNDYLSMKVSGHGIAYYCTSLLKKDGTVWLLNNGGLTQRTHLRTRSGSSYVNVTPLTNVIAMGIYDYSQFFLKSNGELWYGGYYYWSSSGYAPSRRETCSLISTGIVRTDMSPPFSKPTNNISNTVKSLTWQPDAERFFIALGDTAFVELGDSGKLAGILEKFAEDKVNFVGMGRSANKARLETFIQQNGGNGTYIDNTNLDTALSSLTTYILNKTATQNNIVDRYILMGEETEYSVFYSDAEYDPQYASRWEFTHDPYYFDNSMGVIANSGAYIQQPITVFDKVGRYEVIYQARDNPKIDDRFDNYRLWSKEAVMNIYVHRKPVAMFSIGFLGTDGSGNYTVNITESSYDLDHTSRPDRGIAQRAWKWKETASTTWNNGQPSALAPNKKYLVQLEVQDIEGVWSDPCVELVETSPANLPPYVACTPVTRNWGNTNVTVNVTASDPSGDYSHTKYLWTTSPLYPSSGWLTNTNTSFNTTQTVEGAWYLHLEAFDLAGNSYYMRGGPYLMDKTPPAVDATPQSYEGDAGEVTAALTASDAGGSGLKEVRYAWTNSTSKPASGWSISTQASFQTTQNNSGTWYLHMEACDNAANTCYRCRGPFVVNALKITGVTIEGYWNHWRGQVDMFGRQLSIEPHRFLSMETVKINVYTAGYADKVVIRFSPELEAMYFTDIYGNMYDYADYFGCHVNFPADSTFSVDSGRDDNHVYWEYTLPLAQSSKSWNDDRIREQYKMVVTAWRGDKSVTYEINDIDITGNVYDLTYIQPIN